MNKNKMKRLVTEWKEAKAVLARIKKQEMDLRLEICEDLLQDEPIGTHQFTVGEFSLKATKKNTISIIQSELAEVMSSMSEEEQACIIYKPSLSLSLYKSLSNSDVIDECLLSKPATPTLSVE